MTVSSEQRGGLSRAVSRLRVLFEDDYADVLEGTFGIHVSGRRAGEIEDPDALSLSAHQLAARAELVGVVEYLRGEGLDAVEAVERMLREAVFTTVNRLLAVRVAEAIGVLPPSLSGGRSSLGFVETLEVFPLLRDGDDSGGYWSYLQVCGDELSHAVPRLFDRRHPLSVLEPSSETLDAVVEVLSDPDVNGVWVEPEALGWSYQFFNTQEERKKMRDESSAPRNSRELAVRNQFFTPSYVVDFLVENTLGRRLRESGSELELSLLLGEVDEDAPPLDLDDVSVLDPAVGSGHFLLGAYDLLERAWEEQGVSLAEAAPKILASLYGVDIDARAAQVAQAVLYLRARRSAPDGRLDAPAIVTARGLPKDTEVWDEVLHDAPPLVRDVVEGLGGILEQAPVLGSLLKPEEYLREAIGERLDTPRLGDESLGSFADVEVMVLDAAERIAAESASTPAERLFAADAADALRFVELMTRRYDTVLMNPPFGEPVSSTKSYIKAAYPWIPWKDYNVLAAFVGRGRHLTNGAGHVGAITSRTAFFYSSFSDWRREVLVPSLVTLVDLGGGVMEHAKVEASAYVLSARRRDQDEVVTCLRLLDSADHDHAIRLRAGHGAESPYWAAVPRRVFASIPGSPIAYWDPTGALEATADLPRIEGNLAEVRVGLQTSDNFRFVRNWWEVRTATQSPDTHLGLRWIGYFKGERYSPFNADISLVVEWEDGGRRIRDTGSRPRIQGTELYFQTGLGWLERTNSAFAVARIPEGYIHSPTGPMMRTLGESVESAMAWLNSRLIRAVIEAQAGAGDETAGGNVTGRHYTVGLIQSLPWHPGVTRLQLEPLVHKVESAAARDSLTDETSLAFEGLVRAFDVGFHRYVADEAAARLASSVEGLDALSEIDRRIDELLGIRYDAAAAQSVDSSALTSRRLVESEKAQLHHLWSSPMKTVVAFAIDALGEARYLRLDYHRVNRRLELMAQTFGVDPTSISGALVESGEATLALQEEFAWRVLSFLVGVVFGRWPVGQRTAAEPLVLQMPTEDTGILVDEAGHTSDVIAILERAATAVGAEGGLALQTSLSVLGTDDLREFFRNRYFGHHLHRYSRGQRKAPIYWHLAVPSKQWGMWVYVPRLSREQLFAIARVAQDKMRRLVDEASQLRRDVDAGGSRADRERLEAVEALLEEVEEFHRVADSVAQSGWDPDLDDGTILNAAPLQKLFADKKWRTDIEKHRKKMIDGDYPWATVQTAYYDRIES